MLLNGGIMNDREIKESVKKKYGKIAQSSLNQGCCKSTSCCDSGDVDFSIMKDEYTGINGYIPDADLQLGCGLPTQHAGIKKGDTVLDLGSGAGNDVFVARAAVGDDGKIIGVDMTEQMLTKANSNKQKLGYSNVEFRLGEIENLPVESETVDVVISNCVLNLVPDKRKAFSEIYRTLKSGAHFCISDIVLNGELPASILKSAEMYAGCVAGALQKEEYLNIISESGFENVEVKLSKEITLPEETLKIFLSPEEIGALRRSNAGIQSITVVGYKN